MALASSRPEVDKNSLQAGLFRSKELLCVMLLLSSSHNFL